MRKNELDASIADAAERRMIVTSSDDLIEHYRKSSNCPPPSLEKAPLSNKPPP